MAEFFKNELFTVVVGACVTALLALITVYLVRRKVDKKCGCHGDCFSCRHRDDDNKKRG